MGVKEGIRRNREMSFSMSMLPCGDRSTVSPGDVGADNEAFGGDTVRQSMIAVTAGGPGFVAVGQEGFDILGYDEWTPTPASNTDGRNHVADNVAAVWTSPDGETWTRVESDPSMAHSGGEVTGWATMFDIAPYTQGLVAVGRDVWVTTSEARRIRVHEGAAVWLSADGLSWRRAVDVDTFAWPDMHAVTVVGDGMLVAGGGMPVYDSAGTWTSQDRGGNLGGAPQRRQSFQHRNDPRTRCVRRQRPRCRIARSRRFGLGRQRERHRWLAQPTSTNR